MTIDPAPSAELRAHTRRSAYESLADELAAMSADSLSPYNLDASFAATVALETVPRVAFLAEDMGRLPKFDVKPVERIPVFAHALLHVNALVLAHSPEMSTFDSDVRDAQDVKNVLLSNADTLVNKKRVSAATVQAIRLGSGYRDLLTDLITLIELCSPHIGTVVERADIEKASELEKLLTEGISRRTSGDPALQALLLERKKVGTLLTRAYAQLERAVDFLRFDEKDSRTLAPSIYVPGGPKSAAKSAEDKPADAPAKPAADASAKPAAPATPRFSPADPEDNPFEDP